MQKDMLYEKSLAYLNIAGFKWEPAHVDEFVEKLTDMVQRYSYPIENAIKVMERAKGYYKKNRFGDRLFYVKVGTTVRRISRASKRDALEDLAFAVEEFVEAQIKRKEKKELKEIVKERLESQDVFNTEVVEDKEQAEQLLKIFKIKGWKVLDHWKNCILTYKNEAIETEYATVYPPLHFALFVLTKEKKLWGVEMDEYIGFYGDYVPFEYITLKAEVDEWVDEWVEQLFKRAGDFFKGYEKFKKEAYRIKVKDALVLSFGIDDDINNCLLVDENIAISLVNKSIFAKVKGKGKETERMGRFRIVANKPVLFKRIVREYSLRKGTYEAKNYENRLIVIANGETVLKVYDRKRGIKLTEIVLPKEKEVIICTLSKTRRR